MRWIMLLYVCLHLTCAWRRTSMTATAKMARMPTPGTAEELD
ncbi:MAG TPA: hypothetical protein VFI46_00690 [Jiangellaceae bacterium]|nr:hypothetical protein [Jiangellaceae bacterium]